MLCETSGVAVRYGTRKEDCVLQCVAVCCSVLQCVAVCCCLMRYSKGRLCVAVCCSVLQCVAVCCSVLLLDAVLERWLMALDTHTMYLYVSSANVSICIYNVSICV